MDHSVKRHVKREVDAKKVRLIYEPKLGLLVI